MKRDEFTKWLKDNAGSLFLVGSLYVCTFFLVGNAGIAVLGGFS